MGTAGAEAGGPGECGALSVRRARRSLAFVATAGVYLASVAGAQPAASDSTRAAPSLRCYRGRPTPACRTFVLTEIGFYQNLATSTSAIVRFPGDTVSSRVRDFGDHATIELGLMQNRGTRSAVGGTVLLGADANGTRYGAKLRYRRWLNADGLSVDLSTGVISGTFREFNRTAIVSTDVALNLSDYGALVARMEAAHANRRTPTALYGGVRLGSKPGLVATIVAAIASLLAVVALMSLFGNE